MENYYNAKRLALILAVQAEIEGMKAENKQRELNKNDLTYNEGHYQEKASELRDLAYSHDDQL